MRAHTNNFKNAINQLGRVIDGRIYRYTSNYNLISENNNNILTEDNIQLITDNFNTSNEYLIDSENIYNMSIVKNGQLLQSLMKEFDFESSIELNVGDVVNPQLGVFVDTGFEYLNYGNYIIYSKEYIAENQTWKYVCYDFMLKSMIKYEPLNLTYPCTIREYLIALADRIGLTFANASDGFTNYNQQVLEELFEGQNITYRDILDKLSEIVAGNILINDDNELEIGYVNETNDTIDEENLKDINVNFGEVFGPINKVAITETDGGYEYSAENSQSIEENGLWQVNINDNLFAFNGNSEQIAQNILNKINGLSYSINDFSTTGVCYYDFLDLFNVSIDENINKCLLLNNEIKISQGLEEKIYTDKLENTENESNNYKISDITNKQVQFQINKQKGEIDLRVRKDNIINAINLSEEQIKILANKLNITVEDILNIIANNAINLTTKNITINSNNFNVDNQGNCTANSFSSNNATITGGELSLSSTKGSSSRSSIHSINPDLYMRQYGTGFDIEDSNDVQYAYYQILENWAEFLLSPINYYNYDKYIHGYIDGNSSYLRVSSSNNSYCDYTQTGAHPTSDKRCKDNIQNINKEKSINIIKNLNPVIFTYKGSNEYHRGLIAQEVVEVLNKNNIENQIYDINENGYYSLCYTELIPDLINCVKYQQEQIETLQKRIEDLERKIK